MNYATVISKLLRALINHAFVIACVVALCYPLQSSQMPTLLERIMASGKLTVASRNGPTTYYQGRDGYTGFDYVLLEGFAEELGLELEIVEVGDLGRLLSAVTHRKVDMAAAGLTATENRAEYVNFSHPYLHVTQQLIYRANSPKPETIEDILNKNIIVISNSSHAEKLRELRREYPELTWQEQNDVEMLDLLEMVHNDKVDFAVVDSNALEINHSVYPRALAAFDLTEPEPLAWALPKTDDESFLHAANAYIEKLRNSGDLANITESFYGHVGHIDYSGALLFTKRIESRLPEYQDMILQAAEDYDLDWHLLAALSYQESHWNPKAKSPTGVRGFMMLTRTTAKEMGVDKRTDAQQSIDGGARYFKKMYERLSDSIIEPDRTWFALAAYNIGFEHLQDARQITQDLGFNPNLWADVRDHLPLLTKRQYYQKTRYGYARGHEAVTYVNNIRNFYNVISWKEAEKAEQEAVAEAQRERDKEEYESIISAALEELTDINAL